MAPIVNHRARVLRTIETVVHQTLANVLEAGLELLPVGPLIQFVCSLLKLFERDIAAFCRREFESRPGVGILTLRELKQIVKVVQPTWRADEQCASLLIRQRGP